MYKLLILIIALLAIKSTYAQDPFSKYGGATLAFNNLGTTSTAILDANSFAPGTPYSVYVSPNTVSYSGTKFYIERYGTNLYRIVETTAFKSGSLNLNRRYLSCDFSSKTLWLDTYVPTTGFSNRWAAIKLSPTSENYVFQCLPNSSEGNWYLNVNVATNAVNIVNSYDPAVNPGTQWSVQNNCQFYI